MDWHSSTHTFINNNANVIWPMFFFVCRLLRIDHVRLAFIRRCQTKMYNKWWRYALPRMVYLCHASMIRNSILFIDAWFCAQNAHFLYRNLLINSYCMHWIRCPFLLSNDLQHYQICRYAPQIHVQFSMCIYQSLAIYSDYFIISTWFRWKWNWRK